MGFINGFMRGLGVKSDEDDIDEILDVEYDEDDEMLDSDYRNTAIRNSKSNNGWYECCKCHKKYRLKDMDADHIVPKSKGGDNTRYNLQLICKHCNRSKRDDTSETYADLERRERELNEQYKEDREYLREALRTVREKKRKQ